MRLAAGAIWRSVFTVGALLLAGLGPGGSAADGPATPISLADDFRGGVGSIWRLQRVRADALTAVRDPTGAERDVLAIRLRSGDMPAAGAERAELSEADHLHLPTGTDVWYGFSLYLPLDFPVLDRRLVLGQWKQACSDCTADHSPAVANRYRNGVFSITIQDGDRRLTLFEERADVRGRWQHLVYHVRLIPRPEGVLRVWLNGRQVVDYRGPLGYPDDLDSVYFKIGLYRDSLAVPMTLLLARFRRGTSRAEVDPAPPP